MFDFDGPSFEVDFSLADKPKVTNSSEITNAVPTEEQMLIQALAAARDENAKRKDSIEAQLKEIKFCEAEIERIKTEASRQIQKLHERKQELEEAVWEIKREIRAGDREIANIENELRLLQEKIARSSAFQLKAKAFDELTAGMSWFTRAKSHQFEGAKILAVNQRCILGDKMGLGKTLTSIMAADMLQSNRLLIIAPSDVVKNFERELNNWAPHRMAIPMYKMTKANRDALLFLLKTTDTPVTLLINYEVWRDDKSIIEQLVGLRFDTVILDEAHAIKNTGTSAYTGVRQIVMASNCCPVCSSGVDWENVNDSKYARIERCRKCDWTSASKEYKWEAEDRRSVKNIFPMSGTPILNRPQELFPLLHLILPMVFHNERVFLDLYCTQDPNTRYWKFAPGGMDRMKHMLQGRYLARDRDSAGVVLPPQSVVVHDMVMDTEAYPLQWKYMQQLSRHSQIILESGNKLDALATIALITRKRQMNIWPAGITLKDKEGFVLFSVGDEVRESIKIDKTIELIEGFGNERTVVFSQFKQPLHEIKSRLDQLGITSVVFDGDTKEALREQIKVDVDRTFTKPGEHKWQVVLCNYKTGGVGLNFTGMTQVICTDEEWNGGKADQAFARVDRIGQTEATTVHILRLVGTIDTWLAKLVEFKRDVVAGFDTVGKDLSQELLEAMKNGEVM